MGKMKLWLLLTGILSAANAVLSLTITSSEARDRDDSQEEEDLFSSSYVLPNQIFNDGKPFYVGKDPVSGQLDFSAKKPAGIEPAANEVFDPKEKIVFSSLSPNIHDFLNLPVKYSSSKFVYPLVSSSYANLKYQGNNKNFITNKKPQSVLAPIAPTTQIPSHSSLNEYFKKKSNSTKLHSVPSTTPEVFTKKATTTKSTTASTQKYTTTDRPMSSTSTFVPHISTTRKKFIPAKKFSSSSTPSNAITTENARVDSAMSSQITITTTTEAPADISTKPSTQSTMDSSMLPTTFISNISSSPAFSPIPSSTYIPTLEPGDVYQAVENKKGEKEHKNTMSIADIFNTLPDEGPEFSYNNQGNKEIGAQEHYMRPYSAAKPSPFVKPSASLSTATYPTAATPAYTVAQDQKLNDLKSSHGSQETFSNEYVQYQVQQPNMMQYRPIPGSINNVVISPGQNSATFVLGSQQTVGTNSFGTVEKEPLFAKTPAVQYGTVINEEISGMTRPNSNPQNNNHPLQNSNAQFQYQQLPLQANLNFHQTNNGQHATSGNAYIYQGSNGQSSPSGPGTFQQPPTAPSIFQQLPMQNNKPQSSAHPSFLHGIHSDVRPQESFGSASGPQAALQRRPQPTTQDEKKQTSQIKFQQTIPMSGERETQELLVSSNIRFPANEEQTDEGASNLIPQAEHSAVNGHAHPLSLQQIQANNNQVVFPKTDENKNGPLSASVSNPQLNEVQYNNNDFQIQKHEVLTLNQHQQQLKQKFNLSQQHMPPVQHMEPPRFLPRPVDHQVSNKAPALQEYLPSGPHISPYPYNEFTRKPIPGMNRPNPDRPLPNILPQFRPNAKLSGGHGQGLNTETGNLRIPPHLYAKRPSSPQFAHRRQPIVTHRYPMNRILEYPTSSQLDGNRRIYRLPPYGGQQQYTDRMYARRPGLGPQPLRQADSYSIERHSPHERRDTYQTIPHHQTQQQQQASHVPEKLAAFEEDDFAINEPPQLTSSKDDTEKEESKLEPVITLQMLQSQKKVGADENIFKDDIDETHPSSKDPPTNFETIGPSQGLYVVYPLKPGNDLEETDINESVEIKDPSAINNDYQNTPFSVVRDQPQEPILMVKNKKPQSLQQQQQQKQQPLFKDKFPYPIEKPDPSYTDLTHAKKRNTGAMIAPRIINGGYNAFTGTETPIAIAYTPTEMNLYYAANHKADTSKFSNVNLASSVIHEIRDTQTEDGLSETLDNRGQNFEKDFMAPFYPSVSLGTATNSPSNGWNVYHSDASTDRSLHEKNNIDRADVVADSSDSRSQLPSETTTKPNFELDSFQPELQGGFKPIYPPGFKIDDDDEHESNRPLALPSRMEKNTTSFTSTTSVAPELINKYNTTAQPSAAALTATETEQNFEETKPLQLKKSTFETSLEALLFGDDEDFEPDPTQTPEKSVAESS